MSNIVLRGRCMSRYLIFNTDHFKRLKDVALIEA